MQRDTSKTGTADVQHICIPYFSVPVYSMTVSPHELVTLHVLWWLLISLNRCMY